MSSNNASINADAAQLHQQPNSHLQPQQQSLSINPQQFHAISRNNSNTSTSSSTKGEFSSTLSTTNSVASSRSQLASRAHQLMATCTGAGASSTPIRSFQRATISSVVKTRAFDNNPVLKGLLTSAAPSGQNSTSNSQTPSPLSTPVFSRSRSLRMSGGPRRYQQSPSNFLRTSSRTPDLYSYNTGGDSSMIINSFSSETQARLMELSSERSELKESLEFSECERQVLIESERKLREILQRERSQWKKEQDELKKQLTDTIAAKIKAESQLTKIDMDSSDFRTQNLKLTDELRSKNSQIELINKSLKAAQQESLELRSINEELKNMLNEKLKYNGSKSTKSEQISDMSSDCVSIVTEMARLRLELNEKDKIISQLTNENGANNHQDIQESPTSTNSCSNNLNVIRDMDTLNKFLDQTVECIKSWPDELASSSHVKNLMKTLLRAYKPEQDELSSKFSSIHL